MGLSKKDAVDEIERALTHPKGPAGRILDIELKCGFHPVAVGAWFPFHLSKDDWESDSVVTQDGKEVRLVLISAISPATGAFRRLIKTITRAGFTPVVVSPIGLAMPAIMRKWGWVKTIRCIRNSESEEWRPPHGGAT